MSDSTKELPPFVVDMHCHAFNSTDLPVYGFVVGFLRGYRFKSKVVDRFIPRLAIHLLWGPIFALAEGITTGVETADDELTRLDPGSVPHHKAVDVEALGPHFRALGATTTPITIVDEVVPAELSTAALFRAAAERVMITPSTPSALSLSTFMLGETGSDEDIVVNHFVTELEADRELREWLVLELQDAQGQAAPLPASFQGLKSTFVSSGDLSTAFGAHDGEPFIFLKRLVVGLFETIRAVLESVVKFFSGLLRSRGGNLKSMEQLSGQVDLFVHSIIDMNVIAPDRDKSKSSHAAQVKVHEQLALSAAKRRQELAALQPPVRGASFHGFVGFSPAVEDCLEVAKDAVENRGFLGVKLYLNTGFWPIGNAGKLKDADGTVYDERLSALYAWCSSAHVPVLAHTGEFNAFAKRFRRCSYPPNWVPVLKKYQGLRLCFGHFGLHDPPEGVGGRAWYLEAADIADQFPGRCFFDVSNTDELSASEVIALKTVLEAAGGENKNRLMYGSDYYMCELNKELSKGYLERALLSAKDLDPSGPFLAGYFGGNAKTFLGLRAGDLAREGSNGNRFRLERWYSVHGLGLPSWLA